MAAAHLNRRPLLALVLLSPVIAEMLSGSTPPLEWLNPIAVLFLIWLYGAGVLVMRETAVRWRRDGRASSSSARPTSSSRKALQ